MSKLDVVCLAIIIITILWFIGGVIECLYHLLMLL